MSKIVTIEQLKDILDLSDPDENARIMSRIQVSASELAPFATWTKDCYTRNCIARTEKYELILLCWDIGAKAPIHGHGGEDCWVYQVQGTVEEVRFEKKGDELIETNRLTLNPGRLTYMNDQMGFHAIGNISTQRAMTLHIYASPIDACKVYNDNSGCFEMKEMSYHTYKGSEVSALVEECD